MNNVLEHLKFIRKHLYSYEGLIALLFLSGTGYFGIVKIIGGHVLQISKICGLPKGNEIAPFAYLIGFVAVLALALIFWLHVRSIPKFAKGELGILFAPNFEEEAEKEVDRIFIHLTQEIKSHELGLRFNLKRLPTNISITSDSDANAVLSKAGGVVAIWGTMEHQPSDQGSITGFSQIKITTIYQPIQPTMLRLENLLIPLVGRKFHIRERTLIADRILMARDVGIVVRNMMGVALLINHKFEDAARNFLQLLASLNALFPPKPSILEQRFYVQVKADLAYALTMSTSKQYNTFLFDDKLYEIPLPFIEAWLNNIEQAIKLDPLNSIHYINMAIYLFLKGDIEGAIAAERKAEKYVPRASSVQNLSLAFLYNFQGNYRLSRNQYRIGLAKKTSYDEGMIAQCLSFIRQTINNFPEKKQLRLALAVLELHRGSKENAINILEELLKDPPLAPQLQGFVSEAKRLLETASSDKSNDGK